MREYLQRAANEHATATGREAITRRSWQTKRLSIVFAQRYPTKQGETGVKLRFAPVSTMRPGRARAASGKNPTCATMLCIQFGCRPQKPRCRKASGLFYFQERRSKMKHVIHCRMKAWSLAVLTKLSKCNCWIKKDKLLLTYTKNRAIIGICQK